VGDAAPEVVLPDQAGRKFKLSSLKGKNVVLYFYPKDETPGCTKQVSRDLRASVAPRRCPCVLLVRRFPILLIKLLC